jgi:hypothetical protein
MNEQQCIDGNGGIVVKFMAKKLTATTTPAWRRQLPDDESKWGRCQFVFDPDCQVYDWLVAYDDLSPIAGEKFSERIEALACSAENTMLVTAEPSSIKTYSSDFCRQFGVIITSQEPWAIAHEDLVRTQTAYPWFYGRSDTAMMPFDQIMNHSPVEKSRLISTVCSSKLGRKHTLHRARFEFTERLVKELPEIERFGKGVRYLNDKVEVLDCYRYHVAIENDSLPDYFTEKLVDSFLGLALPFYFGCTNAADYFPPESFIPIDIFDFEGSINTIRRAIEANEYEMRLPYIKEARRRVLEQHNLFALLAREIEKRHEPGSEGARLGGEGIELYSRRALRNRSTKHFLRTIYEKYRLKRIQAKHRTAF